MFQTVSLLCRDLRYIKQDTFRYWDTFSQVPADALTQRCAPATGDVWMLQQEDDFNQINGRINGEPVWVLFLVFLFQQQQKR